MKTGWVLVCCFVVCLNLGFAAGGYWIKDDLLLANTYLILAGIFVLITGLFMLIERD